MNAVKIQLKHKAGTLYRQGGYPLLEQDHIHTMTTFEEGALFDLYDDYGFVGRGYLGRQNKGVGWLLSDKLETVMDHTFMVKCLKQAYLERAVYHNDPDTNAYRMFNGEGDGIGGLTMDTYDGYLVVTFYSKGIYRYAKLVYDAIEQVIQPKGIYQKKRFDDQGQWVEEPSFVLGQHAPEPLIIKENGVKYATYLDEGAMTGIFLDQRMVRNRLIQTYGKGHSVLNTFSYTGAFSVAAKLGGALQTTSVDLAKRSREKTTEQMVLNGIDPSGERILVEDVFEFFKRAKKKDLKYDLIILDPPAFARSKKRTFSVKQNYTELIEDSLALLNDQGIIVASTNSAKLPLDAFLKAIHTGFLNQNRPYEVLETHHLPEDFKTHPGFLQGHYLKVLFLKAL